MATALIWMKDERMSGALYPVHVCGSCSFSEAQIAKYSVGSDQNLCLFLVITSFSAHTALQPVASMQALDKHSHNTAGVGWLSSGGQIADNFSGPQKQDIALIVGCCRSWLNAEYTQQVRTLCSCVFIYDNFPVLQESFLLLARSRAATLVESRRRSRVVQ